jgi:hypothetical protein
MFRIRPDLPPSPGIEVDERERFVASDASRSSHCRSGHRNRKRRCPTRARRGSQQAHVPLWHCSPTKVTSNLQRLLDMLEVGGSIPSPPTVAQLSDSPQRLPCYLRPDLCVVDGSCPARATARHLRGVEPALLQTLHPAPLTGGLTAPTLEGMRSHQPSLRDQGHVPVLVTRGLTKAFGPRLAVNALDLAARSLWGAKTHLASGWARGDGAEAWTWTGSAQRLVAAQGRRHA